MRPGDGGELCPFNLVLELRLVFLLHMDGDPYFGMSNRIITP